MQLVDGENALGFQKSKIFSVPLQVGDLRFLGIGPSIADGIIGNQRLRQIRRLRCNQFPFYFRQPLHQSSDFMLDVAEHTVGGSDPAVEVALVGADTPYLHLTDSGSLMNGG